MLADEEVIHQVALTVAGLGSDTDTSRNQVISLDRWNQPLQRLHERGFVPRAPDLIQAFPPISGGQGSKTWPQKRLSQIRKIHRRAWISFPGQSEHRVGTAFNATTDQSSEVNAQKRECRIGDRID